MCLVPFAGEEIMNIARNLFLVLALVASSVGASAADKVVIVFPASPELLNVSVFQIAKYRHYYSDAGLDVEFLTGKGGVYAGRQVGTGQADFAEVFGDTAIVLRSQGLPVRIVALLGGKGPMVLATHAGSVIRSLRDLKGKSISILGYQDSTYYVLLAALQTVNLTKDDVDIRALGPSGVIQDFIKGNVQVCACIPDWIVAAEDAGVKLNLLPVSNFVPALAPSIIASDKLIAERPDVVRRFVQATLKAYVELREDPAGMTKVYMQAVPVHQGQEATLNRVFSYYARYAWSGQQVAGVVDPQRVRRLQDIYFARKIIARKSPLADLFTNQFVDTGLSEKLSGKTR
jgi:NitT/TauT family transport system substrate-binding protein